MSSLKRRFQNTFRYILHYIAPVRCALCGRDMTPLCSMCAESLLRAHANTQTKKLRDGTIVSYGFTYSDKHVSELIHRVKFNNQPWWLAYLACTHPNLRKKIVRSGVYICPVPLHAHRFGERGYNQAELFAKALGTNRIYDGIIRVKNTKAQSTIDSHDKRFQNIQNAFQMTKPLPRDCREIILADDVCTTGATLMELRACFPEHMLVSGITLCG